jgi:hypothetical protein
LFTRTPTAKASKGFLILETRAASSRRQFKKHEFADSSLCGLTGGKPLLLQPLRKFKHFFAANSGLFICNLLSKGTSPLIEGIVSEDGVPAIEVEIGSQRWRAVGTCCGNIGFGLIFLPGSSPSR